jgi:hypothetical protein
MAKKLPHVSRHRVGDEVVEVPRMFDQAHLDAHYHLQEMGEHSMSDHDLHGDYGTVRCEHVEGEPVYEEREEDGARVLVAGSPTVGPEFKISWPNGSSVTTPCADNARAYLQAAGADVA